MKLHFVVFAIAGAGLAIGSANAQAPTSSPFVGAENRLAFDLYGSLRREPGNLVFSP